MIKHIREKKESLVTPCKVKKKKQEKKENYIINNCEK